MHIIRRSLLFVTPLVVAGSLVACTTKKADDAAPPATNDTEQSEAVGSDVDGSDPGDQRAAADVVDPSEDGSDGSDGSDDDRPDTVPADCDWDSPKISGTGSEPTGMPADLQSALIGSWQHVAIDGEPVSKDIRYVFPEPGVMIYCQGVPGVTDRAENQATITIDGATIHPPAPHKGFEVIALDDDTMLWTNNTLGDTYLLVRR